MYNSPPLLLKFLKNSFTVLTYDFSVGFGDPGGGFRTGRSSGKPLLLPVLKKPPPGPPKPPPGPPKPPEPLRMEFLGPIFQL